MARSRPQAMRQRETERCLFVVIILLPRVFPSEPPGILVLAVKFFPGTAKIFSRKFPLSKQYRNACTFVNYNRQTCGLRIGRVTLRCVALRRLASTQRNASGVNEPYATSGSAVSELAPIYRCTPPMPTTLHRPQRFVENVQLRDVS